MEGQLSHIKKHEAKTDTDPSLLLFAKDISVTEKKLMPFAHGPSCTWVLYPLFNDSVYTNVLPAF